MPVSRNTQLFLRDLKRRLANHPLRLFPMAAAWRSYSIDKARHDARAGLNVTMLAVPQAVAFATLAQLPIVFGILCAIVAPLVSPFFASSRHTSLGPTNATAFMMFSFFAANPSLLHRESELVPLLVLMAGAFLIVGAMLKVADLLQYISRSVLVGYICGAAVLIIAHQAKDVFGISHAMPSDSSRTFVRLLVETTKALPATHWPTLLVGSVSFVAYFALQKWKRHWPNFSIVLIAVSAIFGPLIHWGPQNWKAVDHFKTFTLSDLMPSFPKMSGEAVFNDISMLIGVAAAVAFLAALENSLMAKTISSRSGNNVDVNQDMFAVGIANLTSAFAGGMPASGSLTRSTLNFESGARTQFSSWFAGIYILIAAIAIALSPRIGVPLIDFVPKAALSALIIALSFALFNWKHIRICLRSTTDDAAVLITTFIATMLAPLHVAIFIGVAISITLFLRKASKPHLVEYEFSDAGELREMGEKRRRPTPAISIVHVEGDLFFGAADLFRTQIQRIVADPSLKVIILRLKNARHLDATSVMALEDMIRFMRAHDRHIIISGATRDVYRVLKQSGVLATVQKDCDRSLGQSNVFLTRPSNPNLSTRDALKRAQQLIGEDKIDVRIFYDPNKA